jgi:hypothetical protein
MVTLLRKCPTRGAPWPDRSGKIDDPACVRVVTQEETGPHHSGCGRSPFRDDMRRACAVWPCHCRSVRVARRTNPRRARTEDPDRNCLSPPRRSHFPTATCTLPGKIGPERHSGRGADMRDHRLRQPTTTPGLRTAFQTGRRGRNAAGQAFRRAAADDLQAAQARHTLAGSPVQAMPDRQHLKPDLLGKQPSDPPGCDTKPNRLIE